MKAVFCFSTKPPSPARNRYRAGRACAGTARLSPHPDPGGEPPRMEAKLFNSVDEAKGEVVRTVARMCAAAAVTAPKSGGQLFLRGKPLFIGNRPVMAALRRVCGLGW